MQIHVYEEDEWEVENIGLPHYLSESGRLLFPPTNCHTNEAKQVTSRRNGEERETFDQSRLVWDRRMVQNNEEKDEKNLRFRRMKRSSDLAPKTYVLLASGMAALGGVLFGYDTGIISGAILQLKEEFTLSCHQMELVFSALMMGALLASISGGFLVDWFGRRVSIIANDVVFLVGIVVLSSAKSFIALVIGRFIIGFAVSLSATAECVYITEISPPSRRGFLVSLNELGITLGFLIAYLTSFLFIHIHDGWRYMFAFAAIFAVVQGVGMYFLPQSPRYLVIKGEEQQARNVLSRLIEDDEEAEEEFERMRTSVAETKKLRMWDIFCGGANSIWRPLLISMTLVFLQQITGQSTVLLYAPMIFREVGLDSNSASVLATTGLGVVKLLVTVVYLIVVDKTGRRRLLMGGVGIMMISLLGLGILIGTVSSRSYIAASCETAEPQLSSTERFSEPVFFPRSSQKSVTFESSVTPEDTADSTSTAATCLAMFLVFAYVAGYSFSFGPGTWLIMSEIFAAPVKGRAIALAMTINWSMQLVTAVTFLDVIAFVGSSRLFLFFSVASAFSVIFVYFFVPETKGKSLELISSELNSDSFCKIRFSPAAHHRSKRGSDYDSRTTHTLLIN